TPPPPAGDGSQPFARPLAEQSRPFVRPPSETGSYGSTLQTKKKSRWPLVVFALLVVAGGAVGVGLAMTGGDKPKVVQPEDTTETPTKVEMATPTNPPTPSGSAAEASGSATAATDTANGSAAPADVPDSGSAGPAQAGAGSDAQHEKLVESKIKKTGIGTKKTSKKVETKKATPEAAGSAAPPVVEKKSCDPFDSMHGCETK
ncbi:MAG: hypothetical protein HOV81_17205, partial [Kofleriaceae bacterium]|nr:hypothetical protein [Kofleriaceae bacterium]